MSEVLVQARSASRACVDLARCAYDLPHSVVPVFLQGCSLDWVASRTKRCATSWRQTSTYDPSVILGGNALPDERSARETVWLLIC
jgi:hypothetical protein